MYKTFTICGVGAFCGAYWCVRRSCSQCPQQWQYIAIEINVARNALRASTTIPQHMTLFGDLRLWLC